MFGQGSSSNSIDRFSSNQEIVSLSILQSDFGKFIQDLPETLTLIKSLTGWIFVPIAVTHSPARPDTDIIIILRRAKNAGNIILSNWFTEDIPTLVKQFVIKTFKLPQTDEVAIRKSQLSKFLTDAHQNERLMLIGGFQQASGELQLLFYRF